MYIASSLFSPPVSSAARPTHGNPFLSSLFNPLVWPGPIHARGEQKWRLNAGLTISSGGVLSFSNIWGASPAYPPPTPLPKNMCRTPRSRPQNVSPICAPFVRSARFSFSFLFRHRPQARVQQIVPKHRARGRRWGGNVQ